MTWLILGRPVCPLLRPQPPCLPRPASPTWIRISLLLSAPQWSWCLPGSSALSLGSHAGLIHVERRSWLFLIASGLATGFVVDFRLFPCLSMGEASKVAPYRQAERGLCCTDGLAAVGPGHHFGQGCGGLVNRCRSDRACLGLKSNTSPRMVCPPLCPRVTKGRLSRLPVYLADSNRVLWGNLFEALDDGRVSPASQASSMLLTAFAPRSGRHTTSAEAM